MSELGESLKAERLRQGLTLRGVFERTRISVGVLQNLEEGSYERIGTPLLVRNFIRTYCAALGIDPEPLLESHASEILACDRQQAGIQEYGRLSLAFRHSRRKWLILSGFLLILIVGAVVAGTWIAQKRAKLSLLQSLTKEVIPQEELPSDLPRAAVKNEPAPSEEMSQPERIAPSTANPPGGAGPLQSPEIKEKTVDTVRGQEAPGDSVIIADLPSPDEGAEAQAPAAPAAEQKSPPEAAAPAETGESAAPVPQAEISPAQVQEHLLAAEASQDVWVQIRVDGKETHNALLKAGEKKQWQVKENARIVLGNAGGISMSWDDKPLKTLGKPGQVVRFQLPDPKYLQAP